MKISFAHIPIRRARPTKVAQTISEYTMVVMLVIMVAVLLIPMIKRGTQSVIRAGADQIGTQADAEQDFKSKDGFLISSITPVESRSSVTTTYSPGAVSVTRDDFSGFNTTTVTNMGITER